MLAFEDVSFRYPGGAGGVHDVSIEIGAGELVSVIGASGSGKSTLLNLLAGFLRPERGRVVIDGADVTALPPERRQLGIVFQSYGLFPHMSAWENVAYPLKLRGEAVASRKARAVAALGRVGMEQRVDHAPRQLSGGQQQRVALARALVFSPRGLLLDEPLSALDAHLRVDMRDEILRVQREAGIATLLVTHDQEEALSVSDRIAVMIDGRIAQIASPRTLYDMPANEAVARFVGHANLWKATVTRDGEVLTSFGALSCATGNHAPGAAVTVLVRPEAVLPVSPEALVANVVRGRAAADRFLGSTRRVDLLVDGGVVRTETQFRTGIEAVAIPPDAIRLLPAAETLNLHTARQQI